MSSLSKSIIKEAYKLVCWQLIAVMGLALILLLLKNLYSGLSALSGGLSYCLPNFLFVWRVFTPANVRSATRFVAAFFVGETIKLFLSAAILICTINYLKVELSSAMGGYIMAIVSFWIISAYFMTSQQKEAK